LARPEETPESILFPAGHDVYMQVRHALADTVINGNESPVCCHPLFDSKRDDADIDEQHGHQMRRQVG
jgi:hypothetical protein